MKWKLAEAKNKLSEVVNRTLTEGPQTITRRADEIVLISKEEFLRLNGQQPSPVDLICSGASLEGVDLQRKTDQG